MNSITGSYRNTKGDAWELAAELPADPITHKRNRKWRTIHGTERDAKRELRKFLSEIEGGLYVATDRTTVSQWMQTWMSVYQEPINSPTTVQRYKNLVRQYIEPTIGSIALQDLNTVKIQAWVNSLKLSPATGKPLSASTIRHAYNLLSPALDKAVDAGILAKSPCTRISLPKGEKKEAVVYDEEQMKLLVAAAKGTEMELVIDMELCFGMRRGEILGLQWRDIEWEKKKLHIIRTRVVVNGEVVVKPPKTPKSIRTLDVPETLLKKLKAHKNKCMTRQLNAGVGFSEENYVIVHPDGKPIYPEYLTQLLTKLQNRAGLPHCRFHDLRHPYVKYATKKLLSTEAKPQSYQICVSFGLMLFYRFTSLMNCLTPEYSSALKFGKVSNTLFTHSGPCPPTSLIKPSNSPTGTINIPFSRNV